MRFVQGTSYGSPLAFDPTQVVVVHQLHAHGEEAPACEVILGGGPFTSVVVDGSLRLVLEVLERAS